MISPEFDQFLTHKTGFEFLINWASVIFIAKYTNRIANVTKLIDIIFWNFYKAPWWWKLNWLCTKKKLLALYVLTCLLTVNLLDGKESAKHYFREISGLLKAINYLVSFNVSEKEILELLDFCPDQSWRNINYNVQKVK